MAAVANVLTSSMLTIFNAWIFRQGYHHQFCLLAVQQAVCTAFAAALVASLPPEKAQLKISGRNYFTMLLPFSVIVAVGPGRCSISVHTNVEPSFFVWHPMIQ